MVLQEQVVAVEQVEVQMVLLVLRVARLFLEHRELLVQVVLQVKAVVHQELLAHQEQRVHRVRQEHQVRVELQQEQVE